MGKHTHKITLPIRYPLKLAYILSLIIALVVAITSITGVLYGTVIYPTADLFQAFMPNDVVNLCLGIPILLGSMWLTRQGQLVGLLFWPGAIFFVLYNYIAYIFALPFNIIFLPCLILVMLSTYTLSYLVANIDGKIIQQQLVGVVPERVSGSTLVGFGLLFFLRVIGVMVNALVSQTPIATAEFSVLIADFIITPAWIIGGISLWRRQTLGYMTGLGLLFQASLLFIALLMVMCLQPLLTTASLNVADIVVVATMGTVCFIPFILFTRGIISRHYSQI
ncbi:hypothetical protein D0962_29915 [Leptolyngbyaceae cyanobacterium CCMR0082]|uniref:Uncharacterized protein n=1 Tax=Adonisia turfae CCMR0082 TaxID=2304604 RepID=A0A6M0SER0_9CYAN|nr:hypothetical protein [Adonisia turfae]NEZ66924.1 hypothetical protein [Adonisia turfae CCMR0082]